MAGWDKTLSSNLDSFETPLWQTDVESDVSFFIPAAGMDDLSLFSFFCLFCILPLFILLLFGTIAYILYRSGRAGSDAWREVARRAGLTFNEPRGIFGRPTLSGDWHGRPVRVYVVTRGSGNTLGATTEMRIEMAAKPPGNASFSISERDFFSRLGRTGEEIRLGEAEFVQRFAARGQPPEFVRGILSDAGLRRLLMQARYVNIGTTGEQIRYSQPNIETDVETMLFLFALLFDLAEAVERENPGFPGKPGF